jgi:hypothetical protein
MKKEEDNVGKKKTRGKNYTTFPYLCFQKN